MFINENKLLKGTLRRSLAKNDTASQTLAAINTAYSLSNHQYFILNLFFGGLITFVVTRYMGLSLLSIEAMWSLLTILLSLILAIGSFYFVKHRLFFNAKYANLFFLLIVASSALVVTSAMALVIGIYGLFSPPTVLLQTGVLFFYITTTQLFNVLAPTYIKSCILISLGALAPVLVELALNPSLFLLYEPIYIYLFAYTGFILIAAFAMRHIRINSSLVLIERDQLLSRINQQKAMLEISNEKLVDQKTMRLKAELEITKARNDLENTVQARTRILSERNAELIRVSQNLQLIQSAAKIVMWEWDPVDNRFSSTSISGQMTGYSDAEILELKGYDKIIHEDDQLRYILAVSEYLKKGLGQDPLEISYRVIHKLGHEVHLEAMMLLIPRTKSDIEVPTAIGIVRDVTEDKVTNDRLLLSDSVFEHSADGIFLLDEKLNYLSVNPRFSEIMDCMPEDMISRPFLSHLDINAQDESKKFMNQLNEHQEFKGQLLFNNFNQKLLTLDFSIAGFKSRINQKQRYAGTVTDVTELLSHQRQLSYVSNYDLLTDLPNRKLLQEHLHQITMSSVEARFAVVRINIDRFSVINNSLGQNTGDQLLKLCAERITQSIPGDAMLARFAADDFCLVQDVSNPEAFELYLENLHHSFNPTFNINDQELNIRVSMGVSFYPRDARQIDNLIGQAEQALKSAKKAGGNTYQVFSSNPQVSGLQRLILENELRHAVNSNELVIFYQPKIDMNTFKLSGLEALVRWQHPKRGILPPGVFLPVAYESDLIIELGNEVMRQVCQQLHAWRDILPMDLRVSVNVEAQQFKRDDFMDQLDKTLDAHQINPRNIEIEITESSLLDISGRILDILSAIKDKNITIALDDFGTGYSSLSYLNQYPIDVLKIDRAFIDQIGDSKQSDALVKAIVAMGHALDLDVVAEGVETAEHVAFLKNLSCHTAQGYFFGKPMPAEEVKDMIININKPLIKGS